MNATGIEDTFCLLVKLDTPQQKQTSREGMLSDGGIPASFKKFHCCQLKKDRKKKVVVGILLSEPRKGD